MNDCTVAERLRIVSYGWWKDFECFLFYDPLTQTTFTAEDVNEVAKKLDTLRERFSLANSN